MASHSGTPLVPDRPLVISVELARQLGLEEATLLTLLHEATRFQSPQTRLGGNWYVLDESHVSDLMPFWQPVDIQRLLANLKARGLVSIA